MRLSLLPLALAVPVAACGGNSVAPDAAKHYDAHAVDGRAIDAPVPPDGARDAAIDAFSLEAGVPYAHTITIDGTDDFVDGERFGTTSATYEADVTWDATNVYVGYHGDDIASGSGTKWVFVFVDADPGGGTGAATSPTYNTQHATFPTGFGAEYYLRWKADNTFSTIEQYAGGAWTTSSTPPAAFQQGQFVEFAFPRALLGGASTAGIVTYMINEQGGAEGSYAGLYAGSFTDGYAPDLAIAHYLRADFTASRAPNDPLNEAP